MEHVPSHPVLTCAEARAWEKARLTDEAQEWAAKIYTTFFRYPIPKRLLSMWWAALSKPRNI